MVILVHGASATNKKLTVYLSFWQQILRIILGSGVLPFWNTDLRLDVCYTVDYERLRRARFLVDPVRDDCRVRREVNIVEALDDNFSYGGEQRCEKRCVAKFWRKADALEWSLWVKSVYNGNYARPCNLIRLLNPRLFAIWFRWAFRIVFSRCSMSLRGIFDMERLRDVFLYKSSRTICSASGLSWRSWSKRTPWSAMVMAICACISCFLERTKESAMFVFLRCSQLTRSFSTYSRKYVNTRDSRSVNRFTAVESKCSKGSWIPHRAEASLCP